MRTIEEMVDALAIAALKPMTLVDQLGALYTEDVYVRHYPPMAADGMKTRQHVVDLYRAETEVWLANMADYHHENVRVWKSGDDEIQMTLTLVGATPDGQRVALPVRFINKVRDGLIYEAGLEASAQGSMPMMDLVKKADMPVELIWNPE